MTTKEKVGLGIIVALTVALAIFITLFVKNKNARTVAEHNIEALNDTVTSLRLANGDLIEYKNSLVIEKKELEEYLDMSKKEIRDLEKKLKADLLYISKLEGSIKVDTVYITDSTAVLDSCTYRYYFKNFDKYYTLGGYTEVYNLEDAQTVITDNEMKLDLKVGLDENWKIFVTTDNPYVSFTSIDGALLDKDTFLKQQKKSRFGVGVQVGIGGQYGLLHKQFDVGPYVGIGLSYNFWVW